MTGKPIQDGPIRVQLSRAKGWRMPENTVKVDRSTAYGNPWIAGSPGIVRLRCLRGGFVRQRLPMALTIEGCIDRHRRWIAHEFTQPDGVLRTGHPAYGVVLCDSPPDLEPLRGKNLACWCRLGSPCHADSLLIAANAPARARPRHAPGVARIGPVRFDA